MAKSRNIYFNPNPLKKEIGDCVVRALCKAEGLEWDIVFEELFEYGKEFKEMPNADVCWKQFLLNRGYIQHKVSNKKGSKRPTVEGFSKANTESTYVMRVANHVVTIQDGYYYDLWDSGQRSVYGYWEKPKITV